MGRFIAVGHQGIRAVSTDGTAWTDIKTGKEGETFRAACFGNGKFIAVGSYGGTNLLAVTADGKDWKTTSKDGQYAKYLRGIGYGKDIFVGIGGDPVTVGSSKPFIVTSADGVTWTDYVPIPGSHILRRLAFGNNVFVGVGDRGRRAVSADGKEWKDAPNVKAIDTLVDVAFGKGVFVGVGLHGLRMTSADGLNWTSRQVGDEGEHLNTIVWADDRFVAVGAGATFISPDGYAWKRHANKDAPLTVAYGGGVFAGAIWKGRVLRSTDGIAWTEVWKAEFNVEAIAWGAV